MADLKAIRALLNTDGVEGPCVTEGYVPCQPGNFYGRPKQDASRYTAIGASGVTVATGCDLGQTTYGRLSEAGVPASALEKLTPYLGLKKFDAIAALSRTPLNLTRAEAEAIDNGHILQYLDKYVRGAYERDSGLKFDTLPAQAQAVVFSVCYQKGCGGVRKDWPTLWGMLCKADWAGASHELLAGFSQYKGRRTIEGRLLSQL